MSRSSRAFLVCVIAAACAAMLRPQSSFAQSAPPQIPAEVRSACAADVQRLCSGVQPGGGRVVACLKQNVAQVSDGCKQAITNWMQQLRGGAGPAPSPAPGPVPGPAVGEGAGTTTLAPPSPAAREDAGTPTSVPPSPAAHRKSQLSTTTASGKGGNYLLMKQVKIIDPSMGKPAYDLLIPTTWQFQGWVHMGGAEGGCFADYFPMFGDAKSADNSIELKIFPQSTWQYIDDPVGQRQMQAQNQSDTRYGMKPCPVRAPMRAADFIRQDLIAKYSKGKTVVSIDPYPELNQMVRSQLGLPAAGAGGGQSGILTDAARARLEYTDDNGQPVEEWITAAVVVRPVPTGRATAYDWHAIKVMSFRTPKGQLDANEKLFKLITSTIRPEPAWQQASNQMIATIANAKQQQLAKQGAMIAQFQLHVVQTINGVVANQQRGANNAAFGQDQLVRGVQTFRDPTTGATFELSNLYDHAWHNGGDEYVMSEDPNFNPNGSLNGNWTEMQVVRPQP
jgi:hypothetical protein